MSTSTIRPQVNAGIRRIHDVCRPGVIIHLLFPKARTQPGLTLELIDSLTRDGFYEAVEIAEVEDPSERKAIRALCESRGLRVAYWLSLLQFQMEDSISSPNEVERQLAVSTLARQIPHAMQCGAQSIGIVSGRDVPISDRPAAIANLGKSVVELARVGADHGLYRFEMETMDRDAHKRQLLGPTDEAMAFFNRVRTHIPDFHLVFDTAHMRLLDEDPEESLVHAASIIGHIHLSNCVSDRAHTMFGDHHLPIGEPGFLTIPYIRSFLGRAIDAGVVGSHRPILSIEVGANGGDEAWNLEAASRRVLEELVL